MTAPSTLLWTQPLAELVGAWGAIVVLLGVLVFIFFLVALVCDESLTPALQVISKRWNIPPSVACATLLALGSSIPEISVNIVAVNLSANRANVNLGLGTLLGSALISFTLIPMACVLVSPDKSLDLDFACLARDIVYFGVGLFALAHFTRDGRIDVGESLALVGIAVLYFCALTWLTHRYRATHPKEEEVEEEQESLAVVEYGTLSSPVEAPVEEDPPSVWRCRMRYILPPFHLATPEAMSKHFAWLFLVSALYICLLSDLSLLISEWLALDLGISHQTAGLLLVSLGAQVPDAFSSMAVARRGEGPGAIANCIGSQVINMTLGLGMTMLASNLWEGRAVETTPLDYGARAVLVAVFTFVACAAATRAHLGVKTGAVLLGLYVTVFSAALMNGG